MNGSVKAKAPSLPKEATPRNRTSRIVTKGINYTEIETKTTVQYYRLSKVRELEECGVWIDGRQVKTWKEMAGKTYVELGK